MALIYERLRALRSAMRQFGLTRQVFEVTVNGRAGARVVFSAAFLAEGTPWTLLLGVRKHNRFERLNVYPGYRVDPLELSANFIPWLRDILNLEYDEENPFTRARFIEKELFEKTPIQAKARPPYPHEIPADPYSMEEGNKQFFLHWLLNGPGRHVTRENLQKTRDLINAEWAELCRQRNISSCWTANESERCDVPPPPL